jgi:hypothetical protein
MVQMSVIAKLCKGKGIWSPNSSDHGRILQEYFNPRHTIASQVQFISGDLQASNSNPVLILEDDSHDSDKFTSFVIPHVSWFSSSHLPLLTQFLRWLSMIWQVLWQAQALQASFYWWFGFRQCRLHQDFCLGTYWRMKGICGIWH